MIIVILTVKYHFHKKEEPYEGLKERREKMGASMIEDAEH